MFLQHNLLVLLPADEQDAVAHLASRCRVHAEPSVESVEVQSGGNVAQSLVFERTCLPYAQSQNQPRSEAPRGSVVGEVAEALLEFLDKPMGIRPLDLREAHLGFPLAWSDDSFGFLVKLLVESLDSCRDGRNVTDALRPKGPCFHHRCFLVEASRQNERFRAE